MGSHHEEVCSLILCKSQITSEALPFGLILFFHFEMGETAHYLKIQNDTIDYILL